MNGAQCDQIWRNFAKLAASICTGLLGNFKNTNLFYDKMLKLVENCMMVLGTFSLLQMAKH